MELWEKNYFVYKGIILSLNNIIFLIWDINWKIIFFLDFKLLEIGNNISIRLFLLFIIFG